MLSLIHISVFGTNGLGLDITESYGGGTVSATAAFSPNLTAGVEVALGTFGASGKLPVDIPKFINWQDGKHVNTYSTTENVYKLGYGITYDLSLIHILTLFFIDFIFSL